MEERGDARRGLWVARAPSPDARFGHHVLRSLHDGWRFAILAPLAAEPGSQGTGNPEPVARVFNPCRSLQGRA